jgi:GAF domain-containing protein
MDTRASDRIAEEQDALRRLAGLAARGASPEEMFGAVTAEVTRLLAADMATMLRYEPDKAMTTVARWTAASGLRRGRLRTPQGGRNVGTLVFETGRPARIDDYLSQASGPAAEVVRKFGIRSSVGAPIGVEGRLWGVMLVSSTSEKPLPPDAEARVAGFTELLGTAIANAQARVDLRGYADEQAALRRVATLVARGAPPEETFTAVAEETGRLLDADGTAMARYDLPDRAMTTIALWSADGVTAEPGYRTLLGGRNVSTLVFETGRPARIDDYLSQASGPAGDIVRRAGIRSGAGVPISVEGRVWGVLTVGSTRAEPLPTDTEARLTGITELLGTAIANAQARVDLRGHADEQAALRRVATLVAGGAPPEKVFAAVAAEAGRLLGADLTVVGRYDPGEMMTVLGAWSSAGAAMPFTVGTQADLGGENMATLVFRSSRPTRFDDYGNASGAFADVGREWGFRATVGAPIRVEGRLWGLLAVVSTREELLPDDTEARLTGFTELVGTAIANAQARVDLRGHADEQAALRRVATLVARAAPPEDVFAAVSEEIGRVLVADFTTISRYETDGMITVVGVWTRTGRPLAFAVGDRLSLGGQNVPTLVYQTGQPARIDDHGDCSGALADAGHRGQGFRSVAGVPISVGGRLWGVVTVGSTHPACLPVGTRARLAGFTELIGTAIANAEAQAALAASRARVVAAADEARRRIERDLHDGAQQRLVTLALQLREAQAAAPPGAGDLVTRLDGVAAGLETALAELREIARGIHPAILAEGGLGPALTALARRCAVPVDLRIQVAGRLPGQVEIAAYYVVSEALTNIAKHAEATAAEVEVEVIAGEGVLRVCVRDDGCGGAAFSGGSGLLGLKDRVEASGGRIWLHSPPGRGTTLEVHVPLRELGNDRFRYTNRDHTTR